jgi:hypothetical protein
MFRITGFAALLTLTACVTDADATQAELLRGLCVEGPGQAYLGQPATSETAELIKFDTRAHVIRWIAPGEMVTMDHRTDRVNIYYGPRHKVVQVTCG